MSVLGNAKSNRHRKTHEVEPGGPARKFRHLTRGGLLRENAGEVSRGRSSVEAGESPVEPRAEEPGERSSRMTLVSDSEESSANSEGVTTAVATRAGGGGRHDWLEARR